jgi:DNA-binding response OmpR family regulator
MDLASFLTFGQHPDAGLSFEIRTMPIDTNTTQRDLSATARDADAFLFGQFVLLPATRTLLRDGRLVHVGDRAHDILIALIERAGQIVSKADLPRFYKNEFFLEHDQADPTFCRLPAAPSYTDRYSSSDDRKNHS